MEGRPAFGIGNVGAGATVKQPVGLLHTAPLDEMVQQRFAVGGGAVGVGAVVDGGLGVVREGVGVPDRRGEGAVGVGAVLQEQFVDFEVTGVGRQVDGRDGVVAGFGFGVGVGPGFEQFGDGGWGREQAGAGEVVDEPEAVAVRFGGAEFFFFDASVLEEVDDGLGAGEGGQTNDAGGWEAAGLLRVGTVI